MKECSSCNEIFSWDDEVVVSENKFFHKECVTLYPTGYVVFDGDHCIGESENDDGNSAFEVLEEGEYREFSSFESDT